LKSDIQTYFLKKLINQLVDSTIISPSLAEMVRHHLWVDWTRQHRPPYMATYKVFDNHESYLELVVTDAPGYPDRVYERGLALMKIGVNGALASSDDEFFASEIFGGRPFRTCKDCGRPFRRWLDYYGHIKTTHWETRAIG
jgi:hypothetical protein